MKIIVDILMFILMLLEFSKGYMKPIFHEIFGIALCILVVIHLILNRNYLKSLFKGKYNTKRSIMLIVNLGFFITFFLSILLGLLSSQELLKFMNIKNINITNLHKVFAYISLIFMGLHLGINFNAMFGKLEKKVNKIVIYIIEILLVIYGIYSFIKLDILKHLIGTYGFSVLDGNIIINILRYISLIMMIAIIINKLYSLKRKDNKNER